MASVVAATLAHWSELARSRYGDVTVDVAQLAQHLAKLEVAIEPDHPHAADLVLAFACAARDAMALAVFDRELMSVAASAARRIDSAQDFIAEVTQLARERLLTAAAGSESRIAAYAGAGPLKAWVRVAAIRIATDQWRARKRDMLVDDEAFFDAFPDASEHQRQARERYGQACSDALRAGFAKLTARERHLLRMHHLHGLTVDELAPTLGVHRATVARWIQHARERLHDEMRAGLQQRLQAGDATVDSILRELAGGIEISVSRLLAE